MALNLDSWNLFLTAQDRAALDQTHRKTQAFGLGQRPALLVVDNVYRILGFKRLPILESIKRWPLSFGVDGWNAIDRTAVLLGTARDLGVPVIFSRDRPNFPMVAGGYRAISPEEPPPKMELEKANEIVQELAPRETELVIEKVAPSPFFGTPLVTYLNRLRVDTLVVCGNTTSGCVRAAVVDAYSYQYRVGLVAECCMDRTQASHHMSLFDMSQKYSDLMDVETVRQYFGTLKDLPSVQD